MLIEGVEYRPDARGRYYCPNRCGNPDYPQPHWSTEKGFSGHLAKCRAKPDAVVAWVPEAKQEREKFADCPDCGAGIWKMAGCWEMQGKTVCLDCYRPYYERGIGYHAPAGFDLPGFTLEG